jgi:hypothetical protein
MTRIGQERDLLQGAAQLRSDHGKFDGEKRAGPADANPG